MQVLVDDLMTEYKKTGKGPAVLLLHGWGDNLDTFKGLQDKLSKNFTVISLDLPGFGNTQAPNETFTLKKYAQFVHSFTDKIEVKKVYAVIGHSNGGAISIKAIADAELQPEKLVLLASSGIRSTYKARKKALRLAAKAAKIPTHFMPTHLKQKLKKAAYKSVGSDLFVAEHLQKTFKEVVGEDVLVPARRIKAETLLVYGDKDTATLPAYGKLFEDNIPRAKLKIVQGAAHFLHHTHADQVEKIVQEFLDAA